MKNENVEMIFSYITAAVREMGPEELRELADDLEHEVDDIRFTASEREEERKREAEDAGEAGVNDVD